ncbi:MAG: DUF3847 domain-containing protein [Clostridiaceae bacterium]
MAKTKLEKIVNIGETMRQLENQRKQLSQQYKEQERKDRTKQLCKRAGLLESLLPDTIPLTNEQFKSFLEKTLITEHSRRILDGIQAGHWFNGDWVHWHSIYHNQKSFGGLCQFVQRNIDLP